MSITIEFNNISKQYRLGLVSTKTLSHDLKRWWTINVRRQEDPYLKIGEANDRSTKGGSDYVWALKDINFKVEQGDVVGIIGKNGAGKSTLLKILSKVTAPTTGTIKAKGRIGSLLEVGTGFHPEMTGRENIYLNGAILGMTKQEITKKLDEIVGFSGCERYIDTPVKRYSSGMMVRLGFAVAAHLDPEILVVDEVLAVGDAEFQKKAIGKMQDVSRGEGRTVLFVSHNMAAVRKLCHRGILLENGSIAYAGGIDQTIDTYMKPSEIDDRIIDHISSSEAIHIDDISINHTDKASSLLAINQGNLHVHVKGHAANAKSCETALIIRNRDGAALAFYSFNEEGLVDLNGPFEFERDIALPHDMHSGILKIDLIIHQPNTKYFLNAQECCMLEVEGRVSSTGQSMQFEHGLLTLHSANWKTI